MSVFVALDLETTGLSSRDDAIIEYAFIKFDSKSFEEYEVLSGFVNPGVPIPPLVQELTGIGDQHVFGAPSIESMLDDIESFLGGLPLVGHNIDFDIGFLRSAGISLDYNPTIDTFHLANSLCFKYASLSLSSLCEYFSIGLSTAHRALDDTRATYQLLKYLSKELFTTSQLYPDMLSYLYKNAENPGDQLIYQTYIKPSFTLLSIEKSDIKQKHISQLKLSQKSYETASTDTTEVYNSTFDILQSLPKFEYRESQKKMCDIVDSMYSEDSKFALEAPTGTGKTFVYLIGALLHARKTGAQTCIATSTKLLQDQICEEDISYLREHLPFTFSYAKLTGKKNYFSLGNFHTYIDLHKKFTRVQLSFFLKLYLWSLQTPYGELRELEYYGEEYSFLSYIDASNLFYDSSELSGESAEFYFFARRKAELSDIIITNSYVLIQECIKPTGIFALIDTLVVDEAHSLEDVTTSSSLLKFSQVNLEQLFSLLERKMQKYSLDLDITDIKSHIEYGIGEIFHECEKIISPHFPSSSRYKKYLFRSSDIKDNSYLTLCAKSAGEKLLQFESILSAPQLKKHFSRELQVLEDMKHFLFIFFVDPKFSEYIYIGEITEQGKLEFSYTILDTGVFLRDNLWKQKTRILLTSATLFVPAKQLYSDKILGIREFVHYTLPPVFDYKKQSYVYIPTNLKNSRNLGVDTIDFLEAFFSRVLGNTLMLCTSYSAIKELYIALHSKLGTLGVQFIAQGFAGGKNKHLENFLSNPDSSILLGTDSFWQGVDIPGDALKYLVIHKLPFTPPSDPIFIARSALFQDAFYDYAIPKTGIKLRQGLGRLIRSHSDTGMILFLDDRVIHQKWGRYFLDIFPEDISIFQSGTDNLLKLLSKE